MKDLPEYKLASKIFGELNLDYCFLRPTETALRKSIIDCIKPVREVFRLNKFHDYDNQGQGEENRIVKKGIFLTPDDASETLISLYRPNTKKGDPRIWFSNLKRFVKPYNLIALILAHDQIIVVNCSDDGTRIALQENIHFLRKQLHLLENDLNPVANELLGRMIDIHKKDWVKRWGTKGPKAVGWTTEYHCGLKPNSSKSPDYKGIELKSHRSSSKTRYTLFSKAPDWKISNLKSTLEILKKRGRFSEKDNRLALYNDMHAKKINTHHLTIRLSEDENFLRQWYSKEPVKEIDVCWKFQTLKERLYAKHPETFWIGVDNKFEGDDEYYRYKKVQYTSKPNINYFKLLLNEGLIELDYTMHLKPNGKSRDHGYLFKIWPRNINSLFDSTRTFDLAELA